MKLLPRVQLGNVAGASFEGVYTQVRLKQTKDADESGIALQVKVLEGEVEIANARHELGLDDGPAAGSGPTDPEGLARAHNPILSEFGERIGLVRDGKTQAAQAEQNLHAQPELVRTKGRR